MLRNEQRLGARVINRAAEELAARFNPERIALAISSALHSSELLALQETLSQARSQTADVLASFHPRIPTRDELLAQAQVHVRPQPARSEKIVDRAHQLLLGALAFAISAVSRQRTPRGARKLLAPMALR